MESKSFTLTFKNGINIYHVAIAVFIVILFFILKPSSEPETVVVAAPKITTAILNALKEQNLDKPLEYNEAKPTYINDMKKHLRQFDALIQSDPERAQAALTVVRRRMQYLKNKDLEIDEAEKILNDHLKLFFHPAKSKSK